MDSHLSGPSLFKLPDPVGMEGDMFQFCKMIPRLHLCKKEVAPHRKTQSLYVDDKQVPFL